MEGVWSQEIPSRKFRNPNKPLHSEVGDVVVEVYGVDAVEEEEEERVRSAGRQVGSTG